MTRWRYQLDGALTGAENMAADLRMLEALRQDDAAPCLRLYQWQPPCLSLGRHQDETAADLDFCRRAGIDVVRRPTGGRAVLHHLELTYAVAAPLGTAPLPRAVQEAYRTLCAALVAAARRLGVAAELTPGDVNLHLPNPRSAVPCFEGPAGGEVVVGGRKLIGSAMRVLGTCILQHGSILLDWDDELQAGAMGVREPAALRARVTTFAAELGRPVTREEVERAVVEAFTATLGVTFEGAEAAAR